MKKYDDMISREMIMDVLKKLDHRQRQKVAVAAGVAIATIYSLADYSPTSSSFKVLVRIQDALIECGYMVPSQKCTQDDFGLEPLRATEIIDNQNRLGEQTDQPVFSEQEVKELKIKITELAEFFGGRVNWTLSRSGLERRRAYRAKVAAKKACAKNIVNEKRSGETDQGLLDA